MGKTAWPKEAIDSETMDMLHSVLMRWCNERGRGLKTPEASAKARELVEWFEFGVKDPSELKALISESR
jgi:hypothetical protein